MLLFVVHTQLFAALPTKALPVVNNQVETKADTSNISSACIKPETSALPVARPADVREDYSSSAISSGTRKKSIFSKGFQWIKGVKNYWVSLTHPLFRGYGNRDNGLSMAAFICGCLGVLTVGFMCLPITFSVTAIDIAIVAIIALGSFAFWAGLFVTRSKEPGLGWAIAAMVLGCITILPPISWLVIHCFLNNNS